MDWKLIEIVFCVAMAAPLGMAFGLWLLRELFDYDLIGDLRNKRRSGT